MRLGADRKKLGILGALLLLAGYVFYSNVISSDEYGPPAAAPATVVQNAAATRPDPVVRPAVTDALRRAGGRPFNQEFRPKFKVSKPGEAADLVNSDPTLRLDLLAKIQAVTIQGGERNLFQFGPAPAPKVPDPKIVPKTPAQAAKAESHDSAPVAAVKPPPPPIPLKFYGYTSRGGRSKQAFFLDGEDVVVATEGELIKKRYKVVGIGINSVVMEDVQEKHQQTLPLEEQPG